MMTLMNTNKDQPYGIKHYMADTVTGLTRWPSNCAPGSLIYAIDTGKTYILNNEFNWVVKVFANSSSSDDDDDDINVSVDGGNV